MLMKGSSNLDGIRKVLVLVAWPMAPSSGKLVKSSLNANYCYHGNSQKATRLSLKMLKVNRKDPAWIALNNITMITLQNPTPDPNHMTNFCLMLNMIKRSFRNLEMSPNIWNCLLFIGKSMSFGARPLNSGNFIVADNHICSKPWTQTLSLHK